MGTSQNTPQLKRTPFIQATPGSHGGFRDKTSLTVYTDHELFSLKYSPSTRVDEIKDFLQRELGVLCTLSCNNVELNDSFTLAEASVRPNSVIKASALSPRPEASTAETVQSTFSVHSDLSRFSVPDFGTLSVGKINFS